MANAVLATSHADPEASHIPIIEDSQENQGLSLVLNGQKIEMGVDSGM